jgi:glycosyltransferase involved in cell wall biosynthesis
MAFVLYDYSNTHQFHRKALLNAFQRVNKNSPESKDVMVIVSTRNMVMALPRVMLTGRKTVVNLVGFGRLYSDYGAAGRAIFNTVIRLYSYFSALAFIVEHDVDRALLEKLTSIPVYTTHGSGLDTMGFERKPHKRGAKLRIGYLSRFHRSKGSHEVLKAAQMLPDDRELIVAGWDIEGEKFARAFTSISDEKSNIQYLGRLETRRDVSDFFNSIDLFLSPSIREGGNISLQEAIWHGVPFITTDSPGCHVLAELFSCPAVPMEKFSDAILLPDLLNNLPDTSGWGDKLKPFLAESVEEEYFRILAEVSIGLSGHLP